MKMGTRALRTYTAYDASDTRTHTERRHMRSIHGSDDDAISVRVSE